jgi:ribonuclease VapC
VTAIVFDSFPILALLQQEGGEPRVRQILRQAVTGEVEIWMSLINLGEVLYLVERRRGKQATRKMLAELLSLPIHWEEVGLAQIQRAAHLKAIYPISYADSFAAALAQSLRAKLLTGDPEFSALENEIVIEWLAKD